MPSPASPVTEQLIAALVPVTAVARPRPAPLPALPSPAVAATGAVLLAMCVADRSGRIGAAPLLAALGWRPGDRVEVDTVHGTAMIRAQCAGRHRIGSRGDIGIPAAVRTMCGLAPGQSVLLAALAGNGVLAVHSAITVTRLLARVHRRILGDIYDR